MSQSGSAGEAESNPAVSGVVKRNWEGQGRPFVGSQGNLNGFAPRFFLIKHNSSSNSTEKFILCSLPLVLRRTFPAAIRHRKENSSIFGFNHAFTSCSFSFSLRSLFWLKVEIQDAFFDELIDEFDARQIFQCVSDSFLRGMNIDSRAARRSVAE